MMNLIRSKGSNFKSTLKLFYKQLYKGLSEERIRSLKTKLDREIIVGTKNGLFIIRKNDIYKTLNGRFYGITFFNDKIYVFERIGNRGRVIRFNKDSKPKDKYEVFIAELSPGCHQIDFIEDKLYITDTYNNRILIFDLNGKKIKEFYPLGKLIDGRNSENYGHINSIYYDRDKIYLLCHNESEKTGKCSELLKLDERFEIIDKIELNAASAHNCVLHMGRWLVCNSLNGSLIADNKEVFNCNFFTRGLAIFDDVIIVGGSEYASREKRRNATGALYILDSKYNLLEKVDMPAMVQEIRGINDMDYSLSNSGNI